MIRFFQLLTLHLQLLALKPSLLPINEEMLVDHLRQQGEHDSVVKSDILTKG